MLSLLYELLYALLAASPILLAGLLLVGLRLSAKVAMPLVYLATVALAFFVWGVSAPTIAASTVQGGLITCDLLLIIFGAILLLKTLEQSGAVQALRHSFDAISGDRRVQLIIVAWLFGSFIEGASGFGTPAAIAAPLLVALRFPPACAVMLGMMIQSTAVTFGAVGTPIVIGVANGIENEAFTAWLAKQATTKSEYLQAVTLRAASFHACCGLLMPTLMVMMMTRFFGQRKSWTEGLSILPFSLFAGAAFVIPYWLTARFLGAEFPSLLGGMVGLAIVVFSARRGWLLPKDSWRFADETDWPDDWRGRFDRMEKDTADAEHSTSSMPIALAWTPYALVAVLLLLTRLRQLPFGGWLKDPRVTVEISQLFGTSISAKSSPLYLPASVFFVVVGLTFFLHRMSAGALRKAVADSCRVLLAAGFVLVFTVPMVRVYINSGDGSAGLDSMPVELARFAADSVGAAWPAVAGMVGALGAFVAGSNTVSNLMFSAFQHSVAQKLAISSTTVVALQAVGAAAGNMIAIHNVVAASATVGLLGQEGATLRKTALPTLYYLAGLALLAFAGLALGLLQ
ncbi:MAG: L-lactate permease [Planctomycetales bacterium]|nr:L-lactate permease [Planctomycetales bacterium]